MPSYRILWRNPAFFYESNLYAHSLQPFLLFLHKWICVLLLSFQSCQNVCKPMDCSPGSSVHGILQASILEWVAMPSSRESSQPRMEPLSLTSSALAGRFITTTTTWEAQINGYFHTKRGNSRRLLSRWGTEWQIFDEELSTLEGW